MLKPVIFSALYALAGISGWSAYTLIGNGDTSLDKLTTFAMQANQQVEHSVQSRNKPVYRYKDENNNWVYSNTPFEVSGNSNYEQELTFLKSLPQEAMPTRDFKTSPQSAVAIQNPINYEVEKNSFNLKHEAQKVMKMLEDRNHFLASFGKQDSEQKN